MKLNWRISLLSAILLSCPPRVIAQADKKVAADSTRHTFVFRSAQKLKSVHVAGTFNGWNATANAMKVDADGQSWRVTLPLSFGKHGYKFVLDGERWVTDPLAPSESDGNGNTNSRLLLLPPDYARPASPRDGIVTRSALLHQQTVPSLNYDRGRLSVSLRTRPGDVRNVVVRSNNRRFPMSLEGSDELYSHFKVLLPWNRKRDVRYVFELSDGAQKREFGVDGLRPTAQPFVLKARDFKAFEVPSWVERSVFYQIFPDRFANGDKRNDPKDVVPWNSKPQWFNRFGGDVAGVRNHLPYLGDLGVSAVYFNPIFQSPSNHRYDAEDFHRIDAQFGTNSDFGALTRELDKRGIRTVLDFVFNHTATTFPPFRDIRDKGAASSYKDWYYIKSFPVKVQDNPNYQAWYGFPSMPKLNVGNAPTRDYLLNLVNFWRDQTKLSGLRLDVANEVDPNFWRALRKRVKTLDKEMWIVGEVWGDGAPWLGGDQWDSVMNYQFRDACLRFFAEGKTSPTQFSQRLMQIHRSYAPQVSRNMMNLLSSHDTPRFLTLCGNDADLHRLAAVLQFTWIGAPSIYYGEEIGMEGGGDPDNRRGMEWNRATPDNAMLRFYKQLVRIRSGSSALQSGDPKVLWSDDKTNTFAFARLLNDQAAIIALNRSKQTQTLYIPLPSGNALKLIQQRGLTDALSGRRIAPAKGRFVRLSLRPLQAAILLSR